MTFLPCPDDLETCVRAWFTPPPDRTRNVRQPDTNDAAIIERVRQEINAPQRRGVTLKRTKYPVTPHNGKGS